MTIFRKFAKMAARLRAKPKLVKPGFISNENEHNWTKPAHVGAVEV